jgi:hypothetical protein
MINSNGTPHIPSFALRGLVIHERYGLGFSGRKQPGAHRLLLRRVRLENCDLNRPVLVLIPIHC